MKHNVKADWKGLMQFNANVNGHELIMDANEASGGQDKGVRPKELMLTALAGCTGMDVISILKKMRVDLDRFNVNVEGELTEEHPKHYTKIHITYQFSGKDLDKDKLQKAIELSKDRYCGVAHVYKKVMELTYSIEIM
ncbi:MAG: osmotically inducible protein C [Bacteroidetes bacterium GWE2_29_8]|nr:MAG: osmotically inducible protein C [Bacteroidetes bacterium GWE2_29_8]OFY22831.1 MAG: osmotically inducible protein C [Bacteroidetes bacterium GWF2_29_10]